MVEYWPGKGLPNTQVRITDAFGGGGGVGVPLAMGMIAAVGCGVNPDTGGGDAPTPETGVVCAAGPGGGDDGEPPDRTIVPRQNAGFGHSVPDCACARCPIDDIGKIIAATTTAAARIGLSRKVCRRFISIFSAM